MADSPTHWHGLKKAETGVTPEQVAERIARETGLPFTVADLERFMAEEMGVKFEEKRDPETGEVVRVPVPPPGMEDWFCAVPVGEAPQENTTPTRDENITYVRENPEGVQRIADRFHAAINPDTDELPDVFGAMVKMFGFLLSLVDSPQGRRAVVEELQRRLPGVLAKADTAAARYADDLPDPPPAAA